MDASLPGEVFAAVVVVGVVEGEGHEAGVGGDVAAGVGELVAPGGRARGRGQGAQRVAVGLAHGVLFIQLQGGNVWKDLNWIVIRRES